MELVTGGVILGGLAVILVLALMFMHLWRPGIIPVPNAPQTVETLDQGFDLAVAAVPVIRELVAGAEQLWRTGKLNKDGRFDWVFDQAATLYPGIDEDVLLSLIEGAVYWLKPAIEDAIEAAGSVDAVGSIEVSTEHVYGFRPADGAQ